MPRRPEIKMTLKNGISENPPRVIGPSPRGSFLVFYNASHTDAFAYIEGYLLAARKLVETEDELGLTEDHLLFPIFFNLIHALELSLKVYLRALIDHRKSDTCKCIAAPRSDVHKILVDHQLSPLIAEIVRLTDHKRLHGNKKIKKLRGLIKEIEKLELNEESLRYHRGRGDVSHKFQDRQRWVYPLEILTVFRAAVGALNRSTMSADFFYCEDKQFKNKEVAELKYIHDLLKKIKVQSKFVVQRRVSTSGSAIGIDELLEAGRHHAQERKKLSTYLETLTDNELVLANRGIRFGKGYTAETVPTAEWVRKSWPRDLLVRHLTEDFHLVNDAMARIRNHQKYLVSRIKIKT